MAGTSGGGATAGGGLAGADNAAGGTDPVDPILAPLAIDDATIDAASGEELFEIARSVGLARGCAVCACVLTGRPCDELVPCAEEESGLRDLFEETTGRCIFELSREIAGFDEFLRCRLKKVRDVGLSDLGCDPELPPPPRECPPPPGAEELLVGGRCARAYYCADDTFTLDGHCDARPDCSDWGDERGCSEFGSRDTFVCGEEMWAADQVCVSSECAQTTDPPLCDPSRPDRFLCGDGTDVFFLSVCDVTIDCATGADENYCLR